MDNEVVGKLRARVAAWRHGNPSRGLKLIAVAGASGKSTTISLLAEILQEAGHSVITLTDRGCQHDGQAIAKRYDVSADSLQHCLTVAKKKAVDYVIIEVSDELVATHSLPTLLITMSVVTNDAPSAQALLSQPVDYTVVPSGFDVAGLSVAPHQAISFGEDESAEAQIISVNQRRKGTEIELVIDHQTKVSLATYLVGSANALNVAAAVSSAYVLATDRDVFEEGIARLERIPGNYDYVDAGDAPYEIVVDGATSEASLSMVVNSAKKLKKRRLLVAADDSVSTDHYPELKRLSDRLVVVSSAPELPGVDRADDMKSAFDLMKRSAKKDDLILLLGTQYAALQDGVTYAQRMLEAAGE